MVSTTCNNEQNAALISDWALDDFFRAVVESSAESIWNALFLAQTMVGRDGHTRHALPIKETLQIIQNWRGGFSHNLS